MKLTEPIEDCFEYEGQALQLDMTFDNILLFQEMLQDPEITDFERVIVGLEMLISNHEGIDNEPLDKQQELFLFIINEFLGVKTSDAEGEQEEPNEPTQKEYDFDVDAERIFASFLMDYNIDLFEEQGKLHWKKFMALFQGLSESTPFMKVVHIRTMDVPKEPKERQRIQKLKRRYALEQKDVNTGLDEAASFLRSYAKVGD